MSEPPPASSPRFPWTPLLLGAAAGGIIASAAGGPAAGAIGGLLGALTACLGTWLLRRPWTTALRWLAALTVWLLGFAALLIGSGFVATVTGLTAGRE